MSASGSAAPRSTGGSMTPQQSLPGTPTVGVSTPGAQGQSQNGPMSQQNLNQIVRCFSVLVLFPFIFCEASQCFHERLYGCFVHLWIYSTSAPAGALLRIWLLFDATTRRCTDCLA